MDKNIDNIILFDGICNLCNSSVNYIIKRDPKAIFRFSPLQSEKGKEILSEYNLPINDMDSFVLISNGKSFLKSTAALRVFRKLGWPYNLLYGFIILPRWIRNAIYDLVAETRYKTFGKRDSCMIPDKNLIDRFIE